MTPKEVLTNPAFCPMPWTGFMYNFDGNVKNCIRSSGVIGNIKNDSIENILLNNINVARQAMIVDKQMPSKCNPCHELEIGKKSFDIISDRKFYIRELKQVPTDTYRVNNFDLHTIDVRWTNLCNFSCVYCGPAFSSKWADELGTVQDAPTDEQRNNFKEYIFKHAHQLKHVYLAGGEPLLMKENLELLDLLDPNINLRINTNLSKVDTQIFERVCKFKNVHWIVSLETIKEEYEYIRYGGNWADFLDNLTTINKLNHKISFNMLWFLLNYNSIFDCVDYLKTLGFHNNSFIIGPLTEPEYLNIRNLPLAIKQDLIKILKNKISEQPGYLLEDSYKNMLKYIKQESAGNFKNSLQELAKLDQRRGLNSQEVFKKLYQLNE